MIAEFSILLTERILSNIVRCSGNISKKWAVPSCMEEGNMPIALSGSTTLGNLESANFSS